ncbi:response regulator [Merismopedia glauca]|uniref:Two-component system response regulator n=1 Tax=Merismopedia glauca CCAP 1448/3 TaxID=1296344 RepID=A0A2T1C5P2_9CYAN|nr:response regulator [Merismopedia glauca]PSB03566.1 two-component system response regulator [Merismopedia glauca CCAP 1448/3]
MNTVLVVEDSNSQRQVIKDLLKASGWIVTEATDGAEAWEKIIDSPPDLVILDIVMPKMNGYEVCRRLKSDPKTQTVPVVLCSSKSEDFDRYWGMKQGADAYIAKPFTPQDLLGTIKKLLKN